MKTIDAHEGQSINIVAIEFQAYRKHDQRKIYNFSKEKLVLLNRLNRRKIN